VALLIEDEKVLRELLWLNHGCPVSTLYGDDGEMQCGKCGIDFKLMPAAEIKAAFIKRGIKCYKDSLEM
jgi:hypothetical protein